MEALPSAPAPVPPTGHPQGGSVRRSRLLLFGVVLACYLSAPNVTNTDAYLAVPTAVSIVHSASFELDQFRSPLVKGHYGYTELDGRHYDRSPWAVAVLFVPGVVIVDLFAHLGIGSGAEALVEANHMGPLQLVTASVVTALAAVVVAVLAFERLQGPATWRRHASFAVGIVFALGTSAWSTASRALWQHGPSMLALALALLAASRLERGDRPRKTAAALGIAVGAAYTLRPTNAIAVVGFSALVAFRHRRWLATYLVSVLSVLAVFVAVNVAAYGRLLPPYFSAGRISLHPAYLEALAANLVSPARGILVFSPVVALAVAGFLLQVRRRTLRPLEGVAAACVVAQLVVVSAQNEGWWAGHAFGPRFMSDVFPFVAYLSLPAVAALLGALRMPKHSIGARIGAVGAALAIAVSIALNAQGAYLRSSTCWNAHPVDIDRRPARVWDLQDPQALAGYRAIMTHGLRDAMLGACPSAS